MSEYIFSEQPNPHNARGKAIIKAHPEVRELFGHYPPTIIYISLLTVAQLTLAYILRDQSWWLILLVMYTIGAVISHGLFALMHEASHNMVFKTSVPNRWAGILTNVSQGFPGAMSFRKYHLYHHTNMGEYFMDADLASHTEAKLVGKGFLGKSIWYLFFIFVEAFRPSKLKIQLWDKWTVVNVVLIFAIDALIWYFWGTKALCYLLLSTIFSVGLHPLGARWIQEHYLMKDDQETYSYYGPANLVNFNIGYHQEHHDLWRVPWINLPKLKKMAPEFYEPLYAHYSWTKLLLNFLFNKNLDLYSRITRGETDTTYQKTFIESDKDIPAVFEA